MSDHKFGPEPFIKIRDALADVTKPREAARHAETLRDGVRVLKKLGATKERFDRYVTNGRRRRLRSSITVAWRRPTEIPDTFLFEHIEMERSRMIRLAAGKGTTVDLLRTKRLSEQLGALS